jgi:hypothetical protein
MSESKETIQAEPPRKSNRSGIIIAIMAVVIIVQGVKIFWDRGEEQKITTQLASTEAELATTMQRMKEIQIELEEKIAEVQKLGGDVTDLQTAKLEIENELKRKTRANGKVIKDLKDKVEGYELLLKNKDEEIEKLKSVNKELLTENKTLKVQKNVLGDSINRLSQTKEALATKVAIASELKAENIRIVGLNDRDKEFESPFRKKHATKIKAEFNIAENNVAPIEGKKIMIRIIDENAQVIFDVARGSGTFILNGKEEFYTASQEILFDNTKQKLTYVYEKGSDYTSGTYTVEIYCDDYKIGSGQFVVK